ncbi:uncharacterized protein P174DRAFT_461513 [Aspergillus novofumigatus IBT 16806]|uniref:Uncharacterized protein n=1 Tax=Aspergillus novofumigatus (strain IBT 16806) TaxID=1392255 RepID=A0A2I1C615_ASPN1|nr:uncharacterized protein P174DRAFT_461513 [Aspergillus novofumigatus IBT 16806]PKX93057.1 hypothetical protein P174DRAFT_461513 [Aspergillus novofumigatus IBT 16806]
MRQEYKTRREQLEENYQHRVQEWKRQKQQGNSTRRPRRQSIPTSYNTRQQRRATVTFPYWDRHTQTLEPGTFCRACTYHWEDGNANDWRFMQTIGDLHPPSREAYFRAFLEAELPQHFLHCAAEPRREGTDFVVTPKKIIAGRDCEQQNTVLKCKSWWIAEVYT